MTEAERAALATTAASREAAAASGRREADAALAECIDRKPTKEELYNRPPLNWINLLHWLHLLKEALPAGPGLQQGSRPRNDPGLQGQVGEDGRGLRRPQHRRLRGRRAHQGREDGRPRLGTKDGGKGERARWLPDLDELASAAAVVAKAYAEVDASQPLGLGEEGDEGAEKARKAAIMSKIVEATVGGDYASEEQRQLESEQAALGSVGVGGSEWEAKIASALDDDDDAGDDEDDEFVKNLEGLLGLNEEGEEDATVAARIEKPSRTSRAKGAVKFHSSGEMRVLLPKIKRRDYIRCAPNVKVCPFCGEHRMQAMEGSLVSSCTGSCSTPLTSASTASPRRRSTSGQSEWPN